MAMVRHAYRWKKRGCVHGDQASGASWQQIKRLFTRMLKQCVPTLRLDFAVISRWAWTLAGVTKRVRVTLILVVLVAALGALVLEISRPNTDGMAVSLAESAIRKRVVAAYSLQFRNVTVYQDDADDRRWVCGWVGWRGSADQDVGFRRFAAKVILSGRPSAETDALLSDSDASALAEAWNRHCQ
jgi:hypothetical protein